MVQNPRHIHWELFEEGVSDLKSLPMQAMKKLN